MHLKVLLVDLALMLYQARFCSERCQKAHTVMLTASALTTDPALRKQRKQKGGNTGKNFTEGWVEFEDKAVAKKTAAMLNGNPIGGKRRSAYHYDLWSLKYLPKFKWDHLTEEISKTPKAALYMLLCSCILQCTSCTTCHCYKHAPQICMVHMKHMSGLDLNRTRPSAVNYFQVTY